MESAKNGTIRLNRVDGIPSVDVHGEVDISDVRHLNAALQTAGQTDAGAVIVSLENATYFDSSAIHALASCRARLAISGQSLLIVQPTVKSGRRILEIAGLLRDQTVFASRDEAIEAAKRLSAERRRD
jgi:anti-anti-sigma factor